MPLTYAEYDRKRNEFRYWAEYGRVVKPTLSYLAKGMYAAADKLASQDPEKAQAFRKMGDAMLGVTGEIDLGSTRNEISGSLETLNGLYPFLEQKTGVVSNQELLKQALEENPKLREEYLTTDETKNTTFEQQLDSIGDFFVISQKAIDAQIMEERRQKVIQSRDVRREQAQERIRKQVSALPQDQRAAEEERLWQEFEKEEEILRRGAEYAQQQAKEKQNREEAERLRREQEQKRQEEDRLRREQELKRQEEDRLRREREQKRQQEELRRQQEEVRRTEGPLRMPKGYDYRDAAIHFSRSMKGRKPEDSAVFKTAEKIHAKRQALEQEVKDIAADVDRRLPPDAVGDGLETIRKLPDRLRPLTNRYGQDLRENLERTPGNREEQEVRLYAEMKKEQLVTDVRRGDLMKRFPGKEKLNVQLEPHRASARRKILEKHFGRDLDKRLRQQGNELTAGALLNRFFLAKEQKEDLHKLLKDTYKEDLEQKLAACEDQRNPEHELFRKEIFEPALRSTKKWKELGAAMGFPKEIYSQLIPDLDTLTMVLQQTVRPEAKEKSLFEDLTRMHPEQPLENEVELAAEKSLYASLHKDEPQPDGDRLLHEWARELEMKAALGDKPKKLEEMRRLDEAADGLKKACLKADLTEASRQMKETMAGLCSLEQTDPELFSELAGDLDREWGQMDLLESRKLREEQKIPEQYLLRRNAAPAEKKPVWPFKPKRPGEKLREQPVMEYEYHAFDKDFLDEKWSDEPLRAEELELDPREEEYTLTENDILANLPKPIDDFISKEWDKLAKLAKRERRSLEQEEKCLSRILAADSFQLQMNYAPSEEEIDAVAGKLRESGGLRQVAGFVDPKLFAKTRRPELILKCLEKQNAAKAQSRQARQKQLQENIGPVVDKLLATGRGKSYFFGLPRFLTGNSTQYENALAAMQEVQRSRASDPAALGPAVDMVKEYLQDKMKVRDREFGRVRWDQCMTFLKYAMPPQEFEQYCLEVNRTRGSLNPNHKDHVSPEMFGPPQTVKEMREEILGRIRAGEGTRHDYALLGAMKTLQLKPEEQPDLKTLVTKTVDIEGSGEFGLMMANASPGLLLRMAEKDDGEALTHYKELAPKLYGGAVNSLEGLEEPVGVEKEMLEIATEGRDLKKAYEEIDRSEKLARDAEARLGKPGKKPAPEEEQPREEEIDPLNNSVLSV